MIEIEVRHTGDGRFEVTNKEHWEVCKTELDVGAVMMAELKFPRSSRENRLLHGAMKSAYDNQRGGPMFSEEDGGWLRLRAWLLCEAGHCHTYEFAPDGVTEATVRALKRRDVAEGVYSFWSRRSADDQVLCRTPRSIAFRVVRHPDFQPIKAKMLDLLCNVIVPGTTPEQLMEHRYTRPRIKRAKKVSQGEDHADAGEGRP